MAQGGERDSCLKDASFKTADELRSIREEKGTRSPEMLRESAANQLYYRASPLDDVNLEGVLNYIDEFANERESRNRIWIAQGLEKYTKCVHKSTNVTTTEQVTDVVKKIRPRIDEDLIAAYRQEGRGSSRLTYADDVAMENLLRRRADEAKEKMRISKYKQHMNQFMKVYKILKGGTLDYSDALSLINKGGVREAYICGMKDPKETNTFWELSRQSFPLKMETFEVNRRRLLKELARNKFTRAVVLLKGGEDLYQYDSNERYTFRQEPFFLWTFGATEPNMWGCLDCWTGRAILFVQQDDDGESSGSSYLALLKAKYEVDRVVYVEQLQETVNNMNPTTVLILNGVNSDSGRGFPRIDESDFSFSSETDDIILYDVMSSLRCIKTNFELDLIRYVNNISSLGHRLLMKRITADSFEYQAEALFKFFVHFVGSCHSLSYKPVCASGKNSSDPEYVKNSRLIKCGDLIIFDMGASFHGYVSSIACTIPAGGMFNLEQKTIYNIVLEARNAALDVIKAGVLWSEVHDHSMKALLSGLKQTGILEGGIEEMLQSGITSVFMPFGIGHFIGLDKFDVGSNVEDGSEISPSMPHLAHLRTLRALKHGMVMVVQVGCYFNHSALRKACADNFMKKFIIKEKINRFMGLGGVFLKENIVVTHQGYEMLTDVPRTIEDVENWATGLYTDDFNVKFAQKEKPNKDEVWFGTTGNPCVNDEAQNRI